MNASAPLTADDEERRANTQRLFNALCLTSYPMYQSEVIRTILTLPLDLSQRNEDGYTPLHMALAGDHQQIALRLMAMGAPLDAASKDGRTPAHIAAIHCRNESLRRMLIQGTATDIPDSGGFSMLHLYAHRGSLDTDDSVLDLICNAADFNPNRIDCFGRNVVRAASANNSWNLAWAVIENGAYIDDTSRKRNQALGDRCIAAENDYAAFCNHPDGFSLNRNMLMRFANVDRLADALSHRYWQQHPDTRVRLFNTLPYYLQKEIATERPWLAEQILGTPSNTVHSGASLQSLSPSSAARSTG